MAYTKKLFYALDGISFREGIDEGAKTNAEAREAERPRGAQF
jgi:hypothetical protein